MLELGPQWFQILNLDTVLLAIMISTSTVYLDTVLLAIMISFLDMLVLGILNAAILDM